MTSLELQKEDGASLVTQHPRPSKMAKPAVMNESTDMPVDWSDPRASLRARKASQARHNSGRRRLVDPTTCDRDYSTEELEFMQAIQAYKQQSGRMFPTWSEVLEVLQSLGYTKSEKETEAGDDSPPETEGGSRNNPV